MKRIFSSHRWILPVLSAALLVGCFATAARWMVYVAVDPDHFNRVLVDSSGQVVHVYEPDTGLHLTTYAADGAVCADAGCATLCAADLDGDNVVGPKDLARPLGAWAVCP